MNGACWLQNLNTRTNLQTALTAANLQPLPPSSAPPRASTQTECKRPRLQIFFPSVPALLNIAVAGEAALPGDAINGINDLNQILGAIGDLRIAGAFAVGADALSRLAGPNVCTTFSG